MGRIYLDHNATTRPHPEVRAAIAAVLDGGFGNPSSPHGEGRAARVAVERARGEVAALCGVAPEEIVFCSGGTEGTNLAVRGAAHAVRAASGRSAIVASPLEHPSVIASLATLAHEGFSVRWLPVDGEGVIDPADLTRLLDDQTALVTVQTANHEIGNCYPIDALARLAHEHGALFHTDAVQAAGRVALDLGAVDLATLSSHKIYGPKGVGAIYQRRGIALAPLFVGGHQERARRPGTENVPGIVGFGAACTVVRREAAGWAKRIGGLRDRLEAGALELDGARRFGSARARVPGTANLGFEGVEGELVMQSLDLAGVAVSTGAACTSGSVEASPVILGLGVPRARAGEAVRFSLGWENTDEEIDSVVELLREILWRVRRIDASGAT